MSRDLYNVIRKAKLIAKDFNYGNETINALTKAKSENEVTRILKTARLAQEV